MNLPTKFLGMCIASLLLAAGPARAEVQITLKSAKPSSSYYKMGEQLAQALKAGSQGEIIVTLGESAGSVQNILDAESQEDDYIFTSPPVLVSLAQQGKAMFADKDNSDFGSIRALFPIPSLTMHFVMAQEAGSLTFSDLDGKSLLMDNGTFAAREGAKYIKLFGLEGKVSVVDTELSGALEALKSGKVDGFVMAGSWPAPMVVEVSEETGINLLTMDGEEVKKTKRTRMVIPGGTYAGEDDAITTTSVPMVVYTTTEMDDDTAYLLTKTFWAQKKVMARSAAWWEGVDDELMVNITGRLHPGALKFYNEVRFPIAEDQR
ncbi:TAXI family TRAP transporter solute-binding subunit [Hoeflea poritis]|uniref:TAXI family TRAP transporter solute-binding subunit n=1 Tax=Hoeflea poritis TaxID=2993659 RepID=A0ABT4VHE1_9HYPH|nr:TAXI family TRAP transporter solute-binding subunit [Hoeflea poritis]MDA4844115.1 TAXI family TRAP transporter solute-binding subunit [Hoeflea poritis]